MITNKNVFVSLQDIEEMIGCRIVWQGEDWHIKNIYPADVWMVELVNPSGVTKVLMPLEHLV